MKRLHIGCFDRPVDGWWNTDITPHLWISRIPGLAALLASLGKMDAARYEQHRQGVFRRVHHLNLMRRLPFADSAVEYVFSAHVFEHLPRTVLARLLRELLRVLAPGGVMRVSVPDLTVMVGRYQPENADDFVRAMFEIDHANPKNRHHWMYSEPTLRRCLEEAGFVDVRRCGFREGRCPDLDLLDNRPDHSLFMEASKA